MIIYLNKEFNHKILPTFFTIFSGFIRLQEVINSWPSTADPIMFRKLNPKEDNKEIFKEIFKVAHMSYHVLDCHIDSVHKYMNEIVEVENSTEFQVRNWILLIYAKIIIIKKSAPFTTINLNFRVSF